MARFLITTWHLPGHIYPQIAIAHALRARGHEVAIYTGPQAAKVVEGEGFRFFPFVNVDESYVDKVMLAPDRLSTKPTGGFAFAALLRDWMVETIPAQVADLEKILAEWKPDAITSDQTMWGPTFILGEKGRLPVAITSCGACCMIPGPDAPPFGLGLPKPHSALSRLTARAVTLAQTFVTGKFRKRLNEIRALYGLPPIHTTALAHLATVPLYIMPATPEFDYDRHDLPPSVKYVGPYLWNKPANIVSPDWLQTLGHARPWVHATEGTIHVGEPLVLRATAQGLAGLEMEVIMTSGGARDPESINLGASAPNLHLTRWIAHSDLLPKTDVIITTGLDLHLTRERLRDLFRTLEEKKRVAELLDRFLDGTGGLAVQIGLEDAHPAMKELSLVGLVLALPGGFVTRVAVLGPMRMNYGRIISAVLEIGRAFEKVQAS
jgi:UDP:flavonoid glycosyltransferase YjiC (YdhE family)